MSITNEKLQIIKDNVSKVYRSGQMDVIKNANSLKGFESNKAMLIDDVSPVTHDMGVKVRSKNMFEGTLNSGIYENENFKISIADSTKYKSMKIYLPVGTYTLASSVSLMLVREVVDGVYGSIAKSGNTYTFSVTVDGDVGFSFRRSDDADWDDSANVWLNEGSTATAYTPYVPDLTAVKVTRCGKNLFNQYAESKFINPYRGIVVSDFCNNANSAMYTLSVSLKQGATFQEGINFGLVRMNKFNGSSARWFQTKTDTNFRLTYTTMNSLDYIPDFYVALVGIYPSTEDNWNRIINNYNIQIEYGKLPTDYEPYNSKTDYTLTADGTVNGVTSLYPNTTLLADTDGVIIDCEYYKDVDKAYNKLSAEIALSGGE